MAKTIELNITGMTCDHCVRSVTNALKRSPGVDAAPWSASSTNRRPRRAARTSMPRRSSRRSRRGVRGRVAA